MSACRRHCLYLFHRFYCSLQESERQDKRMEIRRYSVRLYKGFLFDLAVAIPAFPDKTEKIRTRLSSETSSDHIGLVPVMGVEPIRPHGQRILSYSSHSEPNGLNRNKTVFSVTFQNIKNPKKPYKISIFDAKHQKYKQFVPSSIIGNQIPNLRRWRDVGGM